ncbi:MAG: hypothetical protein OFPII_18950 [Osedax symbiont Rs1]|nr:MAG: hypothetical protein OFPII_18950 [Osedax symbiont Rs1]
MIDNKRVLAIVPARSGSKGLKNKNIKMLNGKPLLGWPIKAGINSRYIDKVVVSTDSEQYKKIALEQSVDEVILRPSELATDEAGSIDVILHALDVLKLQCSSFDIVVLLEPTSPLTTSGDIDEALELMISSQGVKSVVAVVQAQCHHPQFAYTEKNRFLTQYTPGSAEIVRRQDLTEVYYLDGSLYISTVAAIEKYKNFLTDCTLAFKVPKWKSFEIDDDIDFDIVEMLMKRYSVE